jgi:hypothetical protein
MRSAGGHTRRWPGARDAACSSDPGGARVADDAGRAQTTWNDQTWPVVKVELARALRIPGGREELSEDGAAPHPGSSPVPPSRPEGRAIGGGCYFFVRTSSR